MKVFEDMEYAEIVCVVGEDERVEVQSNQGNNGQQEYNKDEVYSFGKLRYENGIESIVQNVQKSC